MGYGVRKMMTINEYNTKVWMYYLQLEKDFCDTLNYVEFSEDNFMTYSKEYSKQLLSICSEIDIICKRLSELLCPQKLCSNINEFAEILADYNDLKNARVLFMLNKEEYKPFEGWSNGNSPVWWKEYNILKHNRTKDDNYKLGNLKNVFFSLAGLYILNRYLCKKISEGKIMDEPDTKSTIFGMVKWKVCVPIGNGFVQVLEPDGGMSLIHEGE